MSPSAAPSPPAVPAGAIFPARRVSPEEFVRALSSGRLTGGWDGCEVTGDVKAAGLTLATPVQLRSAVFTGGLDLSRCRFERGVDLGHCRIAGALCLDDTRVTGPLDLEGVHAGLRLGSAVDAAGEPVPDPGALAASLVNLRVEGCACLTDVRVWGRLRCEHAAVTGELGLNGARVEGDASFHHGEFGEIRTDAPRAGAAGFTPADQAVFRGGVDMNSVRVHGDLRLVGVDVAGELVLQAADVRGNLFCRSWAGVRTRLRNGAWLAVARVRGTVNFGGALVNGDVLLQNAVIGGRAQFRRWGS